MALGAKGRRLRPSCRCYRSLASGTPLAAALMNSPLLCDLDADEIEEDMRAIWAEYGDTQVRH